MGVCRCGNECDAIIKNNKKEWKKFDVVGGGVGVVAVVSVGGGGEVMIMIIVIITHAAGTSLHGTQLTNTPTPRMPDYHQSQTLFLCLNFLLFS